jgi:predicted Zn-ribbon and HTH transcriptional regulator
MTRPPFEVADVIRRSGTRFLECYPQLPRIRGILKLIEICRTSALDGHLDTCPDCGWSQPSYNSCRNRHCPKCQTMVKEKWLEDRQKELLPVPYFHCVFTLPHELNPLILQNRKVMLGLLFKSVNETLTTFAKDPKWNLEGQPGFIAVLHTWNQQLEDHFHLHIVLPRGVLCGDQFIHSKKNKFLFPVKALSPVFAAKYRQNLTRVYKKGELEFHGKCAPLASPAAFFNLLAKTKEKAWNVYAKRPFGGPQQVLEYLGRYTHKVAISNHRILHIENNTVTIKTRNRDTNELIPVEIDAIEFIRRFTLHILPHGFQKIRFYGFLSHTHKKSALKKIRAALHVTAPDRPKPETIAEKMLRLTGHDITRCPQCKSELIQQPLPDHLHYGRPPP